MSNTKIYYKNLIWLFIAALIIMLDQTSKIWAVSHLMMHQPVYILSFFNLTLDYNTGAAFSFLSHLHGGQRWFLISFCTLISIGIIIWLLRIPSERKWLAFSLMLILGGGLANLWDRITLGYVIDFIQWHISHWSWPIFNVGDSAITVGSVILAINLFFEPRSTNNSRPCSSP